MKISDPSTSVKRQETQSLVSNLKQLFSDTKLKHVSMLLKQLKSDKNPEVAEQTAIKLAACFHVANASDATETKELRSACVSQICRYVPERLRPVFVQNLQ